jgi:hypothetical protein
MDARKRGMTSRQPCLLLFLLTLVTGKCLQLFLFLLLPLAGRHCSFGGAFGPSVCGRVNWYVGEMKGGCSFEEWEELRLQEAQIFVP